MPTHSTSVVPSAISISLAKGSTAFASLWRSWISQWTQPQLLKLSDAYLGSRQFHSSQMGGFAKQSLRDPAPKVFMAVGFLNLAHARSLGYDATLIESPVDVGLPQKLPDIMRGLWEGRQPLCDSNGVALGPTGLFEAFTGLRELPFDSTRVIATEEEEAACQVLSRWLRLHLASRGVDWLSEMPRLRSECDIIEPLLMGRTVPGDRLLYRLPQLAAIAGTSDEDLWGVIQAGALASL
jgi:hypothetical protein